MERMSCGRYRLSWRAGGAGADDVEINGYRATIVPAARALARHLGETVHVAALWRDSVM
jgi:DNA-binding IclR family transcriptional regulator